MTQHTTRVVPTSNSPLYPLLARYDAAHAAYEAAKERYDSLRAGIKSMAYTHIDAEHDAVVIDLPDMLRAPLKLSYRTQRRLDTGKFKAEHPDLYDQYALPTGSWFLTEVKR